MLDKLNIKGYHYNPDIVTKIGSYFYDSDRNEDYIQITPDSNNDKIIIITYYSGCEEVRIEAVAATTSGNLEAWINQTLAGL